MSVLQLSTTKQMIEDLTIEYKTDVNGDIVLDENIQTMTLSKGNKYSFEVQSESKYKDENGIYQFNDIFIKVLSPDMTVLKATDGIKIDNTIAGNTLITFIARESGDYALDIFGYGGFSQTTQYGDSTRIDSPYTLTTQDLGQVDIYSDNQTTPFSISLYNDDTDKTAINTNSDNFAYTTITDGTIHNAAEDTDWFSFDAKCGINYKITVTPTDENKSYKRVNIESEIGQAWVDGKKEVISGKNDLTLNSDQYYYLASSDGELSFSITGSKGEYSLTVEEFDIDPEVNTAVSDMRVLSLAATSDDYYEGDLFSSYDKDTFKLENLDNGGVYRVTILSDQLNSKDKNMDFSMSGSDTVLNFEELGYKDIANGKEFYFRAIENTDPNDTNATINEFYLELNTDWWMDVKGEYNIKVEKVEEESSSDILDVIALNDSEQNTLSIGETKEILVYSNDKDFIQVDLGIGLHTFKISGANFTNKANVNIYNALGESITGPVEEAAYGPKYGSSTTDMDYMGAYIHGEEDSLKYISLNIKDGEQGIYYIAIAEYNQEYVSSVDLSYEFVQTSDENDGGDTKNTAQSIEIGEEYSAMMQKYDHDFYKVDLEAGETYRFNYNEDYINGLEIHLENSLTSEKIHNNNQASAGITATFAKVLELSGDNMQKTLDFFDSYSLDTYKSLMTKYATNYVNTTAKEREDFLLYTGLLSEMKAQFNNNDLNVRLTDEDGNVYGNTLDDLNKKLIFSGDMNDMRLTDDKFTTSFDAYVSDLITFANKLKVDIIEQENISQAQIDANQRELSTVEINSLEQTNYDTLVGAKDTLNSTIESNDLFVIDSNIVQTDTDTANKDTLEVMFNNIASIDYATTTWDDIVVANMKINELLSAYEKDAMSTTYRNYIQNLNPDSDSFIVKDQYNNSVELQKVDGSFSYLIASDGYLSMTDLLEYLTDLDHTHLELIFTVGTTQTKYVKWKNGSFYYDMVGDYPDTYALNAREDTGILIKAETIINGFITEVNDTEDQIVIADIMGKIVKIQQDMTAINQVQGDGYSDIVVLKEYLLDLTPAQKTSLQEISTKINSGLIDQLNLALDTDTYNAKTYTQLISEIETLNSIDSMINISGLSVEEQNSLSVAVQDRKSNIINHFDADEITAALTEYTTTISNADNITTNTYKQNNDTQDVVFYNETYQDAQKHFETLKEILVKVDPAALNLYTDTYISDLFSSITTGDFQNLIEAEHGSSWAAHYTQGGQTFNVREDGTYIIEYSNEWSFNDVGEYTFSIDSLDTSDVGDTIEDSANFRTIDLYDTTHTDEKAQVAAKDDIDYKEDGVVVGYFNGSNDKDLYSYEFISGAQYHIKLEDWGAHFEMYDSNGDKVWALPASWGKAELVPVKMFEDDYIFTPDVSGTYYMEASKMYYSKTNEYTLTIEDMNKKDNVGATEVTAVDYGKIKGSTNESDYFKIDFEKDQDWFKIETTRGSTYDIVLNSDIQSPFKIKIFDANGFEVYDDNYLKSIFHEQGSDNEEDKNYISRDWGSSDDITLSLYAGEGETPPADKIEYKDMLASSGEIFYVQIDNFNGLGNYTLDISENTAIDDFGSNALTMGSFSDIDTDNDGIISANSHKRNDIDWFSYNWEQAVYKLTVDSDDIDQFDLGLYKTDGSYNYKGFDVSKDYTANRADTDGSSKTYIVTSKYEFNSSTILEVKNTFGMGNYTVDIQKIVDFNNNPIHITLDDTTSSYTNTDDAILYKTDTSKYTIDLIKGKTYQIELDATGDDLTSLDQLLIELTDSVGNIKDITYEWNPTGIMERATFEVEQDGQYNIEIKTANNQNTGAFTFDIQEFILENDTGSSYENYHLYNEYVDTATNMVTDQIDTTTDKDWFKYNFEEGKQYLITLNTISSDTGLVYLYDNVGQKYKDNQTWDTNNSLSNSDKTILFNPSETKDYLIEVLDATTGEYTLKVEEYTDTADISSNIDTLAVLDQSTNPSQVLTSLIDNKDDKDWIKVTLEQDKVYKIETTPAGDKMPIPLDLVINGIFDNEGTLLEGSASINGIQYIKPESNGTFYIEIAGKNDTLGFYDIQITEDIQTDTISNDTNTTAEVIMGTTYAGKIDYLFDKDWVKVTLEAGKTYDINMKGKSLKDTVISNIYNADGSVVADSFNNDTNKFTLDSTVKLTTIGSIGDADIDYFIEASGNKDLKGTYTIDINESEVLEVTQEDIYGNDANNLMINAIDGTIGRFYNGEINYAGDSDLYKYELEAGGLYEINMYGADSGVGTLTNSLIESIKDSNGTPIDGLFNARGGIGNDSKLIFEVETSGTYYIETASQYNSMGSFKLKVKNQNDPLGDTGSLEKGSHTVMVYLGGDNNLERYMVDDLIEMQLGTLPENWNVTFLIDRIGGSDTDTRFGDWTDTRQGIIKFADDILDVDTGKVEILSTMESLGELNTGDGDTLTNFINWSSTVAEAESYSLILSNHGGGLSGSVWDDTNSHDNLGIDELTASIEASIVHQNALASSDKGFELIGFDTCLQGVIDQQYALKSVTDVVLASEEVSWSDYWDFETWFDDITAIYDETGQATGADMGTALVQQMAEHNGFGRDMTYSAVDTEKLDDVITKFAALNSEFENITATQKQTIQNNTNSVVTFSDQQMDIGAFAQMIDNLNIGGSDSTIDIAAQALVTAVELAVISNATNMSGNGGEATGISVSNLENYANYELAQDMNMSQFFEIA